MLLRLCRGNAADSSVCCGGRRADLAIADKFGRAVGATDVVYGGG